MNQRLCRYFDVLDFDRSEKPPMICYGACACTEQGARETGRAARPTDGSCICQIQIRQTVPTARLDDAGRWLDRDEAAPVTSVSAQPAAGADAGRTRECGRGTIRRPGNGKSQPGKLGAKLSPAQTDWARQWTRGRCHGPDSRRANRSGAVTDVESWRLGRSLPDADLELEPKRRRGKRETPRGRGRERRFRLLSSGPRLPVARTP